MTLAPLPTAPPPRRTPQAISAPAFLIELEPWHKVFVRNLLDIFRRPGRKLHLVARPGTFWADVFVSSGLPWKRFVQSGLLHLIAILAVWAAAQIWPAPPQALQTAVVNRSDVIYYSPDEYLPPLDTGGKRGPLPEKADPEYARQAIISVPPEPDNRSQTIVTPSDVKLNHDVPLPNIVAWADHPQPMAPLAATAADRTRQTLDLPISVVQPAAETIPSTSGRGFSLSQNVVGPAPDVNVEFNRSLPGPQAAVVAPPPSLDAASSRRLGDINVGHSEVVAPAPELPVAEQYAFSGGGRAKPGLGGGAPAVVPPAPSIAGGQGLTSGGRLIALNLHPAAVPPQDPGGNRRGTFAATPSGKPGAAGTPDVGGSAAASPGSGAGAGKGNGLPSGLTVGAPPAHQAGSAVAANGPGSGEGAGSINSRSPVAGNAPLIADATPPRVTATPSRSATEVSPDKANDLDRWIFGDRKFYSMTLNMPNLNSAGGSWVIRFAELNQNAATGELTAPVATQKVDPAYPLELMHRNVQGTVTLYAIIRADGSVSDVRVLNGVDDRLDQFARTALAQWRFHPATKNGSAVDLEAVVKIPFRPVRPKSSF